jgi:predicted amidophosphoribosyltransferase
MKRSWLVSEGPIRYALHRLKYRRSVARGDLLKKHLAEYFSTLGWPVNLVVPVPLGKERRKERGYNQVGLVAKSVALISKWRYSPRALIRIRETRSQIGLSIAKGRENAFGAFLGVIDLVFRSTDLLKNDVATAGAILASCALALMDAGAKSVYALTACSCVTPSGVD